MVTPENTPQSRAANAVNRRTFMKTAGLAGAALVGGQVIPGAAATAVAAPSQSQGFLHSVASGDPLPDSVMIWTRLTPIPAAVPGSGLGPDTRLRWQVATDPHMRHIVQSGGVSTGAYCDHTVKVDVRGLRPATTYYYRFTALDGPQAGAFSRTGRTRTAPAGGADVQRVRFGVCSCSNYEAGFFLGYRDMARRDDIEFVLHLGDYTYEYEHGGYPGLYGEVVRTVQPLHRTRTLTDYRIRQGHYHRDPDLADLHAAKPMVCIWDDHEFGDNMWREGFSGDSAQPDDNFPQIKKDATQAYYEWMPVRTAGRGHMEHLYRKLRYGNLFDLIIPDLRTYRDAGLKVGNNAGFEHTDPDWIRAAAKEGRSMLGLSQLNWLRESVNRSTAAWQLIGNEVMFAPLTIGPTIDPNVHAWLVDKIGVPFQGIAYNPDQWDGFQRERQEIIDNFVRHGKNNVVFLTGDIHTSWAADIPADVFAYRAGFNRRAAATEFITPSITAASFYDTIITSHEVEPVLGPIVHFAEQHIQDFCPWYKYVDLTNHGYMTVDVTPERVQADWFHYRHVLSNDETPTAKISYATFRDRPGARHVTGPADPSYNAFA